MGENTTIEWCDHTFNPWRGCQKVAAGCANCYAEAQSKRNTGTLGVWGPNGTRVVAAESAWKQVERWERDAKMREESYQIAAMTAKRINGTSGPKKKMRELAPGEVPF
jgi:protein gp37